MRQRSTRPAPIAPRPPGTATDSLLAGIRRLGIAVSGGSDSVALLRLVLPLCQARGIAPVVLHLNHGLRGAASAADARFVARLAQRLSVPCRMAVAQIPDARARVADDFSLEMAARQARQSFFRHVATEERLDAIATGHTADDVAETLLLRLARGSGATGLSGLRPRSTVAGVLFVRPLLDLGHAELRAWLRHTRQTWREDRSNRDQTIPRNHVRHAVLPWLERHWQPALRSMLAQSAAILRDEDALLDDLARRALRQARAVQLDRPTVGPSDRRAVQPPDGPTSRPLDRRRLAALPPALQRRVVRLWLLDAGHADAAGWTEVERLLACVGDAHDWQISLPGKLLARGSNGVLSISRPQQRNLADVVAEAAMPLHVPGRVGVAGITITARQARGIERTTGPVGCLPSACSLDASALRGQTLRVRTRRPGDRIQPLGLVGSKSIQDLFVDAKVPAARRDALPLLLVDDTVVWVPGYRVAAAYAVREPDAPSVRVRMTVAAGRTPSAGKPCAH